MKRLFLFDLDGTLVSTGGAGLRALAKAFETIYGVPNAMDQVNPSGKTDPAIFREMIRTFLGRDMRPGEGEALGEAYLENLEREMTVPGGKGALNGVLDFVEHLSAQPDIVLALGTGNLERGARLKLAPHGLNPFFPIGGFGSDAEDRADVLRAGLRRAQERERIEIRGADVFVLGDTPLDVAAAKRAGFRSVAIASGGASLDELKASAPDFVMPDMTHAFDWFEALSLAPESA